MVRIQETLFGKIEAWVGCEPRVRAVGWEVWGQLCGTGGEGSVGVEINH
jgi:hypothetical protein